MEQKNSFLTVSQLNEYVKMLMDSNPVLCDVWLKGEISNFTNHYKTGHFYFSLKDENSLVRAVMFKTYACRTPFLPKDGMKVIVRGRVSAFVRDGQYQIYVSEMLPDGIGSMYVAFEQLRKKLEAEGLFDEKRKRRLPQYPERIGIVTSPTGAAIQDMINILGRRFPCAKILIYPAQVQGAEAPKQLIAGLEHFSNAQGEDRVDVVIIGRGGGSAEDLWAFNNEQLAYAISKSTVPVISAVGHESDFTICDFVADKRAPTPSAAAELAVPDMIDLKRQLVEIENKMSATVSQTIKGYRQSLKYLSESGVLSGPDSIVNERRMGVLFACERADRAQRNIIENCRHTLEKNVAKLEALSPLSVLARGYAVVNDNDGNTIKSVSDVTKNDKISVRVSDGLINATVVNTEIRSN